MIAAAAHEAVRALHTCVLQDTAHPWRARVLEELIVTMDVVDAFFRDNEGTSTWGVTQVRVSMREMLHVAGWRAWRALQDDPQAAWMPPWLTPTP